jgi:1-aminocyclopropane-1-carboxylate deaminase
VNRPRGCREAHPARLPSPLEELTDERLTSAGVRLFLKRDDLIHPEIPGNKWRKLKYNLAAVEAGGHETVLTFGGAYSNHIRAVAAASYHYDFSAIGVIRGDQHVPLNPSLAYAVSRGMRLVYMDRATYRRKTDPHVIRQLRENLGDFYLLPEGGTNELAVRGCAEIPREISVGFDLMCCPCGTGGTLAGIAAGLRVGQRALGFSALKGAQFLENDVSQLQERAFGSRRDNWSISHDYHFGGFARSSPSLEEFIVDFEKRHGLRLDWVYVAKMMYGVFTMIEDGQMPAGTVVVALVTGSDDWTQLLTAPEVLA